jgi:hypothetical protein
MFNSETNIKKKWDVLKEHIRLAKKTKVTIDCIRIANNQEICNQKDIANEFNSYFVNIGEQLASKIAKSDLDPVAHIKQVNTRFSFRVVSIDEMLLVIEKLKNKKSIDRFGISNWLVKKCSSSLVKPLTILFNTIVIKRVFPDCLKIANVVPLHKGGDVSELGNYRPISLLPIFGKICEKIMYNQLYAYLVNNKIIDSRQFGFQSGASTSDALFNLHNYICQNLNLRQFTCIVFIDISKAFDTIDKRLFLKKLPKYGLDAHSVDIFDSYLSNRRQIVNLKGASSEVFSDELCINIGAPQGSCIAPLIFTLMINDLPQLLENVKLYCDDTALHRSSSNLGTLQDEMQKDLNILYSWLCANQLSLNAKKRII